jgi:uncharacterized protein (DUF1499 family)
MSMAVANPRVRWGFLRRVPALSLVLAVVALVLLAVGPIGWRAGWWHFRFAFFYLMTYAFWIGVAGAVIGALALVIGRASLGRRGAISAVAALVIGAGIAYIPWYWNSLRSTIPPIHDITTDVDNPPSYTAVLAARAAEQGNALDYDSKVGEQQKKAYPGVAPVTIAAPPPAAFKRALDTVQSLGWTLVLADPSAGRIEASESSRFFHFTDDVSIRVTAQGAGSRVDIRSVSRQGRSDFGVNAARVERYAAALAKAG